MAFRSVHGEQFQDRPVQGRGQFQHMRLGQESSRVFILLGSFHDLALHIKLYLCRNQQFPQPVLPVWL